MCAHHTDRTVIEVRNGKLRLQPSSLIQLQHFCFHKLVMAILILMMKKHHSSFTITKM